MSDDTCECCGTAERQQTRADAVTTETDRWLGDESVETASLPPEMSRRLRRFYGVESAETLEEFAAATRAGLGGRSIRVEDLCHVDGKTPHVATAGGETHRFRCFYDGVALAFLSDEPVEIRTESPGGRAVEVRASPDGGIETTPSGAAMSFGIAPEAADAAGDPSMREVYGAVCPFVKAFPSREAYERWATGTDAATVGLPLAAGVPVAAALTGERNETGGSA